MEHAGTCLRKLKDHRARIPRVLWWRRLVSLPTSRSSILRNFLVVSRWCPRSVRLISVGFQGFLCFDQRAFCFSSIPLISGILNFLGPEGLSVFSAFEPQDDDGIEDSDDDKDGDVGDYGDERDEETTMVMRAAMRKLRKEMMVTMRKLRREMTRLSATA
ncbi:altered inheritance of mitochondria protein 44-like [Pyrus ussuriensis x Pyrus communis]|uniref:Altered inheritance of mitochondria protein 44-like n=1 Tax=Pyrus ussuriensis x Pyrus communis TaxID=2448454 RepID=A0A5N5FI46_9ROSA|nr:altered inheritance of mitochondria protein 44-like [Pyrus ussuriensis x Pyrus communis]